MSQLHTYIREAIDNLDKSEKSTGHFKSNHDSVDVLIDLILEETKEIFSELRISENTYKNKIEEILKEISDAENPVSEFHSQLDQMEEEVREDLQEYRVLFPLNFRHTRAPKFEPPVTIRDVEFQLTSHQIWDKYQEEASEETSFDEFLEKIPTKTPITDPLYNHRYWEVKYEAAETRFAVSRIEYALEILLGKIAFSSQVFLDKQTFRPGIWRYGTISLNNPLCFLVIKDGDFSTYYSSTDYTPRKRYSLSGHSKERFEKVYPKLPEFRGEISQIEEHLASALKAYFKAISEPNDESRLRYYWQCLEAATLTQEEKYSAADPLKRARATARPELNFEINEKRISILTDKRNSIIHEGGEPAISEGDISYLKTLADHSIWFLTTDRDNYTFRQFKDFYKFGSKREKSILQSKANRQRDISNKKEEISKLEEEIDRIDQVMDWLDIAEED